ncbi:MAG TPA: gamma-glutamyl-gamma-aminobutyrate hydrolase family protein [Geminicoccus sp.]|jgi:GMP synthase (glutamine-hydrolysing)|uniref:glutamine amidotransferase-related protein n=1 Tax=Geminicoccus sp. TaxID=2024832 RepID=UPI002E3269EA|nr:gamma-glutamyl-gamma-aminobutyrate hydrolase family protein [Geminicoccus sp.]HEX2527943.1 gamma-glutamyl-gamma-aminobutyrate hydrolase family protein [Geminicoccus sp.]
MTADRGLRFLVVESESPKAREERRNSVGTSSGETFIDTLTGLSPGCHCDRIELAGERRGTAEDADLASYDGVFLAGSPIHVYDETEDVRRQLGFMRAIFASGTPSFGSCAGVQLAAAAAGGRVRAIPKKREVGFARRIFRTGAGTDHPLLAGRPPVYDAPSVHSDEVESLPDGSILLASNATSRVQAVEIRHAGGIFWGVQYHPELTLQEVAKALERAQDGLIQDGFAADEAALRQYAGKIEALARNPGRLDLAWQLGLDQEVTDPARRTVELRNFIDRLVRPTCSARGRA